MKKTFFAALCVCCAFIFTGCLSSIAVQVKRPAELDLRGANSIAVLPFQTAKDESTEEISILGFFSIKVKQEKKDPRDDIANYITDKLTNHLLDSDFMDVINAELVQYALENSEEIPCDVYLTGYVSDFDESFDEKWNEDEQRYTYSRYVDVSLVYEVMDSETNRIIARRNEDIKQGTIDYAKKEDVPSTMKLITPQLDELVEKIMKELQPYDVTKYLTLLDDKPKTELMSDAKTLAADGYLELALDQYQMLYEKNGTFQAGYNAAIILEALGQLDEAENLMTKVYDKSGEKKALTALNDIQKEKSYAATLKTQLNLWGDDK